MHLLYITIVSLFLSIMGCSDRWGNSPEDSPPSSFTSEEMRSSSSEALSEKGLSSTGNSSSIGSQDACPNLEESHLLTDCRDNQVYTMDTFGEQIWMTQSLRYYSNAGNSWCYKDSAQNCEEKGRLYDWFAAVVSCPFGWHLPDTLEWEELGRFLGGDTIAGGWMRFPNPFGAKPTGYYFAETFHAGENNSYWWSGSDYDGKYARYFYLRSENDTLFMDGHFKENGFAVRCMKDLPSSSSGATGDVSSSSFFCGNGYQGISESTLTDSRDQQEYGTVRICAQEWMKDNLNYSGNQSLGICVDSLQCNAGVGRWYTWQEIMGSGWEDMHIQVIAEQIFPGICPPGWHLPDNGDFDVLFRYIFEEQEPLALHEAQRVGEEASLFLGTAKYLKGVVDGLDLWNQNNYNAGDPYHFGVKPAGGIWSAAESLGRESEAALWYLSRLSGGGSGGQGVVYQATGMRFRDESSVLDHFWGTADHALSVRCVREVRD